mmetsp:Transcript_9774/g.16308  ORF Transcript_9774/g.16308 Transcript_9774/m.16308 type:complete len:301 (-) Transcript_9774:831-1733(-)
MHTINCYCNDDIHGSSVWQSTVLVACWAECSWQEEQMPYFKTRLPLPLEWRREQARPVLLEMLSAEPPDAPLGVVPHELRAHLPRAPLHLGRELGPVGARRRRHPLQRDQRRPVEPAAQGRLLLLDRALVHRHRPVLDRDQGVQVQPAHVHAALPVHGTHALPHDRKGRQRGQGGRVHRRQLGQRGLRGVAGPRQLGAEDRLGALAAQLGGGGGGGDRRQGRPEDWGLVLRGAGGAVGGGGGAERGLHNRGRRGTRWRRKALRAHRHPGGVAGRGGSNSSGRRAACLGLFCLLAAAVDDL